MQVTLPPGCMSIQTEDGATYADRSHSDRDLRAPGLGRARHRRQRTATVADEQGLRLVRRSPYLNTPGNYLSSSTGWECACGHGCWDWQSTCPHCGRERAA